MTHKDSTFAKTIWWKLEWRSSHGNCKSNQGDWIEDTHRRKQNISYMNQSRCINPYHMSTAYALGPGHLSNVAFSISAESIPLQSNTASGRVGVLGLELANARLSVDELFGLTGSDMRWRKICSNHIAKWPRRYEGHGCTDPTAPDWASASGCKSVEYCSSTTGSVDRRTCPVVAAADDGDVTIWVVPVMVRGDVGVAAALVTQHRWSRRINAWKWRTAKGWRRNVANSVHNLHTRETSSSLENCPVGGRRGAHERYREHKWQGTRDNALCLTREHNSKPMLAQCKSDTSTYSSIRGRIHGEQVIDEVKDCIKKMWCPHQYERFSIQQRHDDLQHLHLQHQIASFQSIEHAVCADHKSGCIRHIPRQTDRKKERHTHIYTHQIWTKTTWPINTQSQIPLYLWKMASRWASVIRRSTKISNSEKKAAVTLWSFSPSLCDLLAMMAASAHTLQKKVCFVFSSVNDAVFLAFRAVFPVDTFPTALVNTTELW